MARKRRGFTPQFQARVALEVLRERESVKAIATRQELHLNQVGTWKRQLPEAVPKVFTGGQDRRRIQEYEAKIRELYTKIGELTVERDFFGADSVAKPDGPDPDDRPGQPDTPLEGEQDGRTPSRGAEPAHRSFPRVPSGTSPNGPGELYLLVAGEGHVGVGRRRIDVASAARTTQAVDSITEGFDTCWLIHNSITRTALFSKA